jgi:signal recognition particle subunit SRP68
MNLYMLTLSLCFHRFLHLPLLISERAWAHAMHMKSTHSADTTATKGLTGSTRSHIVSRLHKASLSADELTKLLLDSTTKATSVDILEAKAYLASLLGSVAFEKQSWKDSLKAYSEARVIYAALEISTRKDHFKDLLSTTIDPSIRYCAYQLKLPRTVAIPTVARKHFPTSDKALVTEVEKLDPAALSEEAVAQKGVASDTHAPTDIPTEITWRSRTVKLEDASIATALASVNAAAKELSTFLAAPENKDAAAKDKAAAYDDVLIASQDAVDANKHAIDELLAEGAGQGDKRVQSLQITRTAISYALIGWRIGRNRVLIGARDGALLESAPIKKGKKSKTTSVEKEPGVGRTLAKLRERVALYDSTLQSLDSVKELPGVAADESFSAEVQAKRDYFHGLKCLAIARSHAITDNLTNSLALLDRASRLATQAAEELDQTRPKEAGPQSLEVYEDDAQALDTLLKSELLRMQGRVEIENLSASKNGAAKDDKRPLIDRLDEYPEHGVDFSNLVEYPPRLQPIPVKPVFLDIAYNYIDYPGRATQVVEKEGKAVEKGADSGKGDEKKKGWFGFGGR